LTPGNADNVVHVHTEVEEVSKYVSELNAKTFGTEEVQCGQCLKKCMDVLCCKKARISRPTLGQSSICPRVFLFV